ncbi:hypothetical protein HPP92_015177 [Vanilla planifolia]|uniref:Uncharacterized protein n=1 Tax=Vanilla planifolia TaxID=51239 RepID=A0A835UUV0_VANPL|nr:hypothetical protein HPP92_015177 [Vanilla planifolia]
MESRVSRKGKLWLKGNLPLKPSASSAPDKIELKCEVLEVRLKNIFSGQVDSHLQIMGSILQPNISGMFKLSHGEAYLPQDKGNGDALTDCHQKRSTFPAAAYSGATASGHISRFFDSLSGSLHNIWPEHAGQQSSVEENLEMENAKPGIDLRLIDLKLSLGPELNSLPLILNFAVSELELNGDGQLAFKTRLPLETAQCQGIEPEGEFGQAPLETSPLCSPDTELHSPWDQQLILLNPCFIVGVSVLMVRIGELYRDPMGVLLAETVIRSAFRSGVRLSFLTS